MDIDSLKVIVQAKSLISQLAFMIFLTREFSITYCLITYKIHEFQFFN